MTTTIALLIFGAWVAIALSLALAVYWRGRVGAGHHPPRPFEARATFTQIGPSAHDAIRLEECASCGRIVLEGAHRVREPEGGRIVVRYSCRPDREVTPQEERASSREPAGLP